MAEMPVHLLDLHRIPTFEGRRGGGVVLTAVGRHGRGDPTVFLEQAVLNPRHVEVQILSDTRGNGIHPL
jgi:hypothetical protein